MNSKLLLVVSVVVCVVLGFTIFEFLNDGDALDLSGSRDDSTALLQDEGDAGRVRRSVGVDRAEMATGADDDPAESSSQPDLSQVVGCRVSGRVVDESGRPVPDAHVLLTKHRGIVGLFIAAPTEAAEGISAVSNSEGVFTFADVTYWSRWDLRLRHAEYRDRTIRVDVSARDVRLGDVSMLVGGVLRGRVVDKQTGTPVEGHVLSLLFRLAVVTKSSCSGHLAGPQRTRLQP